MPLTHEGADTFCFAVPSAQNIQTYLYVLIFTILQLKKELNEQVHETVVWIG